MDLRRRFLLLLALRWFATGLLMPVTLLLPLERGLSVAQVGTAMAAQGVAVLLLEVPSGALTDSWGRRPVYVASAVVAIAAHGVTLVAQSFAGFVLAWAITGVFRALDSGPLEAWFVDAEKARGAAREVPSALAVAGGVTSASIAAGSLVSAGLVASSPWSHEMTLAVPYVAAIGVVALRGVTALLLMDRADPHERRALPWRAALGDGVALALGPRLRLLTGAMVLVGVGVAALELFMPIRLDEFSDDPAGAAAVLGVVSAVAWSLATLGAMIASRVLRHVGPHVVAPALVAIEAVGLVVMAAAAGPVVLIGGFWLCYLVHTSFGAAYNALVHDRVDDARRGTALSVTSMAFLGSAAAGGVVLGVVAERTSASVALWIAAAFLLASAALVLRAVRPAR